MLKKRIILGSLAAMAALSLVSCGNNDKKTTENESGNNSTEIENNNTLKAHDGTEVKSTVVNCYMPSPAGLQTSIEKGFEAMYKGIDMVITSGTTGELEARIEAEKTNPVCDVLILASWSDGISVLDDYDLLSYQPKDSDKLSQNFVENTHKIYGTSASAVGVIYNTDNINESEIEELDWEDFGNPLKFNSTEHPFAIPNPTLSGAAKDFVAGLMCSKGETQGQSILTSWINNGIKNGGGNKPALASVESGAIDALVAGVDYNAYADIKKNQTIDIYYPKSGTTVNARPAMIMKSGAHNDAAKLVMDYLMSVEAQGFVANQYLIPGRTDVNASSSRLGLNAIPQLANLNWTTMAANGAQIASKFVADIASH